MAKINLINFSWFFDFRLTAHEIDGTASCWLVIDCACCMVHRNTTISDFLIVFKLHAALDFSAVFVHMW